MFQTKEWLQRARARIPQRVNHFQVIDSPLDIINYSRVFTFLFLFFLRFYLFLERGEGKEKERERSIIVWLLLTWPPLGTWPRNPGMCPDCESNQRPFGSQAHAQSTKLHQPGLYFPFRQGSFTSDLGHHGVQSGGETTEIKCTCFVDIRIQEWVYCIH